MKEDSGLIEELRVVEVARPDSSSIVRLQVCRKVSGSLNLSRKV